MNSYLINDLVPLILKRLSAAVYTQTTDVEGEANDLMTYEQKVIKFDDARMKQLHNQLINDHDQ